MIARPTLLQGDDLIVAADHGQIYILSAALDDPAEVDANPYLDALDDAVQSGRFVGVVPGLIDLMTPGQWNFRTPLRIEVWTAEPVSDTGDWEHEVDVDLAVPDGRLHIEASGGGLLQRHQVPPANYRVRVSGRAFTVLGFNGAAGHDSYRLQLWPAVGPRPPALRKRWPGWDDYR